MKLVNTKRSSQPDRPKWISHKTHPELFAAQVPKVVKQFMASVEQIADSGRLHHRTGTFLTQSFHSQGFDVSVVISDQEAGPKRQVVALEVVWRGTLVCSASRVGTKLVIRHFEWAGRWQHAFVNLLRHVGDYGLPQETVPCKRVKVALVAGISDNFLDSLKKSETEADDDDEDDEEVATDDDP